MKKLQSIRQVSRYGLFSIFLACHFIPPIYQNIARDKILFQTLEVYFLPEVHLKITRLWIRISMRVDVLYEDIALILDAEIRKHIVRLVFLFWSFSKLSGFWWLPLSTWKYHRFWRQFLIAFWCLDWQWNKIIWASSCQQSHLVQSRLSAQFSCH